MLLLGGLCSCLAVSGACAPSPSAGTSSSATTSSADASTGQPPGTTTASEATAATSSLSTGAEDSITSDTTHGADESSSGTEGEPLHDFLSIYIAGEGNVGPIGVPEAVVLEAAPLQLELLSDGDFVVFGEEDYQTGGVGPIYPADAVYRFSGVDGTLVWKQLQHTPKNLQRLLGVASDDAIYVAAGSPSSFFIRRYEPDGEISLRSPDSGDALEAELEALAGPSPSTVLSGSIVTSDDRIVAGITLEAAISVFAVFEANTELSYVSSRPMSRSAVGLRERAPGEIVSAASEVSDVDGVQMLRLQLIDLQLDTGELSAVVVDTDGYEAGPTDPSDYAPTWSPVDLQLAEGGDVWLIARENYFDDSPSRHHIFRVAADGTVVAHALAEPSGLAGEIGTIFTPSLTVTPDGPLVVGYYSDVYAPGAYQPYSLALRYDDGLTLIEDYQHPELAGYRVDWMSVATRDGRSIMVGEIEHAAIVSHGRGARER